LPAADNVRLGIIEIARLCSGAAGLQKSCVTGIKYKIMTISEPKITRSYHQEDIQQILQIAIARQAHEENSLANSCWKSLLS